MWSMTIQFMLVVCINGTNVFLVKWMFINLVAHVVQHSFLACHSFVLLTVIPLQPREDVQLEPAQRASLRRLHESYKSIPEWVSPRYVH